jgi:uncharacterized protein (TIGR03435 family)
MKRPNHNAEESVKTFLDSLGNAPQAAIEASRDRLIERFRAGDQLPAFEVDETPRRRSSPWLMAAVAASLLAAAGVAGIVAFRNPAGPVVAVAENESKVVTLPDGSRLSMRPGSELSFYREEGDRCIQLVRGDVVVNAAKQEAGHHLCVKTKDFTVTVVGTLFTVRVEERGSSVSVEEGTVWVQQGSMRKSLMAGGRFSTIVAEPEAAPQISTSPVTPSKPAPPQFDVVSIRKTPPDQIGRVNARTTPAGYRTTNTTLKELVLKAYDLRAFQVSGGPAWIDTERFAVEARTERFAIESELGARLQRVMESGSDDEKRQANATFQSTFQSMMQDMLATRFKLKVRRTTEQASAYALVLNGKTSKLEAGSLSDGTRSSGLGFRGSATMGMFVQFLSRELGQPVVDRTGLPGVYKISLDFMPEDLAERRAARGGTPGGGGRGGGPVNEFPDLRTALQDQLGLKLDMTKVPVEFLVIESVEQPSEN